MCAGPHLSRRVVRGRGHGRRGSARALPAGGTDRRKWVRPGLVFVAKARTNPAPRSLEKALTLTGTGWLVVPLIAVIVAGWPVTALPPT